MKGPKCWICPNRACLTTVPFSAQPEPEAVFPEMIKNFPAFVAIPLKEYFDEKSRPRLKLQKMCEAVELFIKFLLVLGITDLRDPARFSKDMVGQFKDGIEGPTIKQWKAMAQTTAKEIKKLAEKKKSAVPRLPELVEVLALIVDGPKAGKSETAETIKKDPLHESLEEVRNQLAHGGIRSKKAIELLETWSPRVGKLIEKATWLKDLVLIGRDEKGQVFHLKGFDKNPVLFTPGSLEKQLASFFSNPEAIGLVAGNEVLPLWPLALFGKPRPLDTRRKTTKPAPQLYASRGNVQLEFTPLGSEEIHHSLGDQESLECFIKIFQLDQMTLDFGKMVKEWKTFVGRKEELNTIHQAISTAFQNLDGSDTMRVLWLYGKAGSGKSAIMARVTKDLFEAGFPKTIVVPYLFKVGETGFSRFQFLKFAVERLQIFQGKKDTFKENEDYHQKLKDLLQNLSEWRVLFILDGIDEISLIDPTFSQEIVFGIPALNVVWLCSGRSGGGLENIFSARHCVSVFPDGLPAMSKPDIRTMISEKIGLLRSKLCVNDKETEDGIENRFIDKVVECAEGLPMYVYWVIMDIKGGNFAILDATERLPPSLEAYHEDLLKRCQIGTIQSILTPLVCHLALSMEPLTPEILAGILVSRNLLAADRDPVRQVLAALESLQSVVTTIRNPQGKIAYALYHTSFQERILNSPQTMGAANTARIALLGIGREKT